MKTRPYATFSSSRVRLTGVRVFLIAIGVTEGPALTCASLGGAGLTFRVAGALKDIEGGVRVTRGAPGRVGNGLMTTAS